MESIIAEIVIAVLAFVGTIAGSIMVSQKTTWRLDQLEKKVEVHNQITTRVFLLEADAETKQKMIDEIREELRNGTDQKQH